MKDGKLLTERLVHSFYEKRIRPHIKSRIAQQRLKLVAWDVWGYIPLFMVKGLSLVDRFRLLYQFIWIDWNVLSGHKPSEMMPILRAFGARGAVKDEVVVEAGCWLGAGSAKFSLLARIFGYTLLVYDSFQGVEPLTDVDLRFNEFDFSGEYVGTKDEVVHNVTKHGNVEVTEFYEGWFIDTIAVNPPRRRIGIVYIDCDIRKGTHEVLQGVVPNMADSGVIFTQDFHIRGVRDLLEDPATWRAFGISNIRLQHEMRNLASIRFLSRTALA
jgi:O-methyltransferase